VLLAVTANDSVSGAAPVDQLYVLLALEPDTLPPSPTTNTSGNSIESAPELDASTLNEPDTAVGLKNTVEPLA